MSGTEPIYRGLFGEVSLLTLNRGDTIARQITPTDVLLITSRGTLVIHMDGELKVLYSGDYLIVHAGTAFSGQSLTPSGLFTIRLGPYKPAENA